MEKAKAGKDAGVRTRFHGQLRFGPQSRAQLDDQDLADALKYLQRARSGLALARAQENAELPRIQREEGVRAACALVDFARRLGADVCRRNHYELAVQDADKSGESL